MNYFLEKRKSIFITILIIFSFAIFAVCNVSLLWHFHQIPTRSMDFSFHWQRVNELVKNSSSLPQYATNMFSGNGSAVMTMYPYLFLYPAAVLLILIHSVVSCSLIILAINTFLALMISYFSSLPLSHKKVTSFIFATTYAITSYFTALSTNFFYTDELEASIFMPLVIFGFIYYLKNNRWIMLSAGMTLIIYSSVIISAITPVLLLIWLIFNYRKISKRKIINLIKAISLTITTSSLFILPAVKLMLLNKIKHPMAHHIITSKFTHILKVPIMNLFSPHSPLTIYSILGLFISLMLFKKFSPLMKQAYIFSVAIVILGSDLFPWWLLNDTFIDTIQHTSRVFLLPQVILTYLLALFIQKQLQNQSMIFTTISLALLILLIFTLQFSNQKLMYNKYRNTNFVPLANNQVINVPNYQFLIHHSSYDDYYPQVALKHKKTLLMDQGIAKTHHQQRKIQFTSPTNGQLNFHITFNATKISLPFLYYYGNQYRCYLDGKHIKSFHNHRQLITIHHIKSGWHSVKIQIFTNKTTIISRFITVIGVCLYIWLLKRHFQYKTKKGDS